MQPDRREARSAAQDHFKRPDIEAPLTVWEYAMTLERWVVNAEERLAEAQAEIAELKKRLGYPEFAR